MTAARCAAVGVLLNSRGHVIGQMLCELDAGHDSPDWMSLAPCPREVTPVHRASFEWAPEAEPDLDLFDPDEHFDTLVSFDTEGPCLVPGCSLTGPHGVHAD